MRSYVQVSAEEDTLRSIFSNWPWRQAREHFTDTQYMDTASATMFGDSHDVVRILAEVFGGAHDAV